MRKGRDGEKSEKKKWKKKKITAKIVATTSLPVKRLSATDCNAAARAIIEHCLTLHYNTTYLETFPIF